MREGRGIGVSFEGQPRAVALSSQLESVLLSSRICVVLGLALLIKRDPETRNEGVSAVAGPL